MTRPDQVYRSQGNALYCEENALQYRQGGYHPVSLGDVFNDQYLIVHKLGYGSFGTVWLARDTHVQRWVSLKILRADQSTDELEHYEAINSRLQGDLASANIVHLLDHFQHTGINGTHQCLVLDLLGPSVSQFWSSAADSYPDTEEILMMTIRLLEGIVAIHASGFAFGDLSTGNFAFTFGNVPNLSKRQILSIIGPPMEHQLYRKDGRPLSRGVPSKLITTARFDDWPSELDVGFTDFNLLDLGGAFPINLRRSKHNQPAAFRPPESIFRDEVGYESDLWSLGLMIYWFIFLEHPFTGNNLGHRAAAMIDFVGPLPAEWLPRWRIIEHALRSEGFDEAYKVGTGLTCRFRHSKRCKDPDVQALLPVIQGLMRFRPEERISAKEALDSVMRICERSTSAVIRDLKPFRYHYA